MGQVERIIYVGPSLYGVTIRTMEGELWRPPAKQGDILRDVLEFCPKQIVLLDGCFYQSLSVWYKELVYALLEGIVCIGAASMGAIRAAELHRYGMIGVGKIFEMYWDGEEDDSLVAMTFDPVTYEPLSEAPVGQDLKRTDALEALSFSRSYTGTVNTTLDKTAISPYLDIIIRRILDG
jgi:hypothetical protein